MYIGVSLKWVPYFPKTEYFKDHCRANIGD